MQNQGRTFTPAETVTRRTVLSGEGAVGAATFGPGIAVAQPPTLNEELDAVREATAAYRGDHDAARQAGWSVEGPFVPRIGYHYIDEGNVAATPSDLDPTVPAVLVYDDPAGDQDLLAADYLVDGDHASNPPDLFTDASADVKTSEEEGWEYILPENETGLHAWVWFDNPKGVFHPTIPRAPNNP